MSSAGYQLSKLGKVWVSQHCMHTRADVGIRKAGEAARAIQTAWGRLMQDDIAVNSMLGSALHQASSQGRVGLKPIKHVGREDSTKNAACNMPPATVESKQSPCFHGSLT